MMKDKIQIHVINSVKGGCGKTAFSLFKALEVAQKERDKDLKKIDSSVIWIDVDFKGSASKCLLYGKDKHSFENMNKNKAIEELKKSMPDLFEVTPTGVNNQLCFHENFIKYTINDYLREDIHELEKMIIRGYAYDEQVINDGMTTKSGSINGIIDFIFSSSNMIDKKLFNYGSGLPTIEIGRFTYLMQGLLKELIEIGNMGTRAAVSSKRFMGYNHIIIDMPPGDDAYSSALLHMIRQLAEELKNEIEIHFYTLTTGDRGHMYAMTESLRDTCERLKKYKHEEKVYAVLSEIRNDEFSGVDYKTPIQEVNTDGKINVLRSAYHVDYDKFCRDMDRKSFAYTIEEVLL